MRALVKRLIPKALFEATEPCWHWLEAVFFNISYGFPARQMKVIGVTGTNGKTSTTFLIHNMLREAGYKAGLMTTIAYGIGEDIRPQNNHMTNVPVKEFMRRLSWMHRKGVEWLVLETTSHALVQHRVWGVPYSVAVMTNVTHDHLDYHRTFERYRDAKVRLFRLVARNHSGLRTGIVNADDPSWRFFADVVPHVVTYGLEHGELRANKVQFMTEGSKFEARYKDLTLSLQVNLPGSFNISNALAAVATGVVLGLSDQQIVKGIATLRTVEGRMISINEGQKFAVIVDFAHTPDALDKVLTACRELTKGRVLLVFGATGDRDKTKRPLMGKVAVDKADLIFLTDDETYTEDPKLIISDVYRGIEQAAEGVDKTTVIDERLGAIKTALSSARAGDTVVLTGMGHLTTRNMGGREVPWDEIEIVRQELRDLVK